MMPVSIAIASFGVDCGTWRILFMMLFMIVCIFWVSLCVVVLLSAPYVIIGMMHVSTSFHIIAIFSPLKFLAPPAEWQRSFSNADSSIVRRRLSSVICRLS